jgi:hypothetical protein
MSHNPSRYHHDIDDLEFQVEEWNITQDKVLFTTVI